MTDDYGEDLLNRVESFVGRFVVYPTSAARTAHVLWVAHTHRMDAWESTPRIFFESPEPGSGKTRALEVTELLVPRPVLAVNTSPAYLFRKVSDEAGSPTVLYDEIDTVFGPKARENEDIRGLLNAGHRKGAVAGRCVVRGKVIETQELPAYCAVALAGIDDVPDTLMSRSIVIRMRRRAPGEIVEPFRRREAEASGLALRDELAAWSAAIPVGSWPEMPPGIEDRDADVCEALLVVADTAGGSWPERARRDLVTLVTLARGDQPSLGVRLLTDLETIFGGREHMLTVEILEALNGLVESPWGDLHGKPLDARGLARRLSKYGVERRSVRVGAVTGKGYSSADLNDPWRRYVTHPISVDVDSIQLSSGGQEERLGPSPMGSVTSVTPVTSSPHDRADGPAHVPATVAQALAIFPGSRLVSSTTEPPGPAEDGLPTEWITEGLPA